MEKREHVLVFSCRRSSDREGCTTASCSNYATAQCTFALGGKAAGKACGRAVCIACAPGGVCPPHQRLEAMRSKTA